MDLSELPSIRTRVCGLLQEGNALLLLKHVGIGRAGYIWSPPGGGVGFDETVGEALQREFVEEVNLKVDVGEFLFVNDFRDERFHAVELFFKVRRVKGSMQLGHDPEMKGNEQILKEARYIRWPEIDEIPMDYKHNAFRFCETPEEIMSLRGFHIFHDI